MSGPVTAVHQFHHSVDSGDGVTGGLLFTQRLLRALGFESRLFAANAPAALRDRFEPHAHLGACDPDTTLLLHHHSMGHDLDAWLDGLPLRRALVYHNITPAEFFPDPSPHRHYAVKGRAQLRQWRTRFAGVLADSRYNADDLVAQGYARERITVLPLLVDTRRLGGPVADTEARLALLHPELVQRPALLFVGRLVENKRQHLLLEALWQLQRLRPVARERQPLLVLAGGGSDSDYGRFLRQRAHQLGLDGDLILPGKVDDATLQALYRHCRVYQSASAHEGFGMPLVEAMHADLPVVAMATSNVPHTLGEGGLLLDSNDPAPLAAATALLLDDPALRQAVLDGQRRALAQYDPRTLARSLAAWLNRELGIAVPRPDPELSLDSDEPPHKESDPACAP